MRNLICLGRTTTALVSRQSESEDLPITAIAPIPTSEDAFFVSHGPTCTIQKVEVLRVQVYILLYDGADKARMGKLRHWRLGPRRNTILIVAKRSEIFDILVIVLPFAVFLAAAILYW